ncbi:hypothetical protein BS78_05G083600 [Paspalum vaginatum]|nr:hypothetical protein BS78_05G083600 [Paspalum vaginatum]
MTHPCILDGCYQYFVSFQSRWHQRLLRMLRAISAIISSSTGGCRYCCCEQRRQDQWQCTGISCTYDWLGQYHYPSIPADLLHHFLCFTGEWRSCHCLVPS